MEKNVLVIDDDKNTARFLSVLLSENGYDSLVAYDGQEGLKRIEEEKVDLIVLDVMMPKKTGFVLFKQLKQRDEFKHIPVLMLTGVASVLTDLDQHKDETFERPYDSLRESLRQTIRELRETGDIRPEMFVDKPVNPEAFIKQVRELMGD